jgi:hypothetical protein
MIGLPFCYFTGRPCLDDLPVTGARGVRNDGVSPLHASIQASVLDRFGDVRGFDIFRSG